jgi:NTP pyrophosphatase (non-canonical NTP hydrolase)
VSVMINDPVACNVFNRIFAEIRDSESKHPKMPADPIRRAALLVEEVGEVMKAAIDQTRPLEGDDPLRIREVTLFKEVWRETTQVAAQAIRQLSEMEIEYARIVMKGDYSEKG